MDAYREAVKFVLDNDPTPEGMFPQYGWIQWKGTDACIDIHCGQCGHFGHMDQDFLYFYKCPMCGTAYGLGQVVRLIRLPQNIAQGIEESLKS